ncbi:uncharacterized protein PHALS_08710 [Plasmopara halstedii]|uniref:Uncharacterized protein n=1 Tax=Plasmopara halstedii TaxID=4781 RepID=A0A0P1ADH8_PLAHL|nr:uncharacterized protein PHALS_08710 [Plasmopara halstedii]CEG38649.1 hypothetical protein PHALS_08710 [Plasmopara halstedii]|eukprot:XP_024575018.1 hypothetical protein PHALS_08710 [Plasmopara halstedii]
MEMSPHTPTTFVVFHTGEDAITAAQDHYLSSAHGPAALLAIAEKRGVYNDAKHHDPFIKSVHESRLGSPAEVALQTPTSSQSRGIPATSQDTVFDPGDDVDPQYVPRDSGHHHSRREEAAAGDNDWVERRPVTRDALRALRYEVCRDRDSAERHAGIAYRCAEGQESLEHVVHRLPHVEDYRVLSERLLAVEQRNAPLHAKVECLAQLEMKIVALRVQKQLLVQLLGGRALAGAAPSPTIPR